MAALFLMPLVPTAAFEDIPHGQKLKEHKKIEQAKINIFTLKAFLTYDDIATDNCMT